MLRRLAYALSCFAFCVTLVFCIFITVYFNYVCLYTVGLVRLALIEARRLLGVLACGVLCVAV